LESKFIKTFGLIGLGTGILLILFGFILTPDFLAAHFNFVGTLNESKIQQIQFDRYLAASVGILVAAFSALYLTRPLWVNGFFTFATRIGKRLQNRSFYLPFCVACFFIALILGFWGTMSGPGISSDSVTYITVAESLYHGSGFYDYVRSFEYTAGAPLYPLSIAAFMHLGLDAEQAARLIPILSFALLMLPLFFLNKNTNSIFNGYVVCLITLVFMQLLFLVSMAWTEMPYILFSVLAVLFTTRYAASDKANKKILFVAGLFTALAFLTRYIGVTLVLVGLIVIVVKNGFRFKKLVPHILIFGAISCLPMLPWLYRNFMLTSHLQGFTFRGSGIGLFDNFNLTVATLIGGYSIGQLTHLHSYALIVLVLIIVAIGLIIYYVRKRSAERAVWLGYLEKNYVIIAYTLVYLAAAIIIYSDLPQGTEHRYAALIYPFLTATIISFIFYAYRRIEKPSLKPNLFYIITISCALLIIFQASTSIFFLQNAKNGLALNAPFWRESQGIAWAESNIPDDAIIYSNTKRGINFWLRKPSRRLPVSGNDREIEEFVKILNSEDNLFVICFTDEIEINGLKKSEIVAEINKRWLSISEVAEINQKYNVLAVVAEFPDATIWQVRR